MSKTKYRANNYVFDQNISLGSVPDNKSQTNIKMLILHIPGCHPTSQIFCLLGQKRLASRSNPTPECIHATCFSGSPMVTLVKLQLALEVVGITEKIGERGASCCFRFTTGSGVRGQMSAPVSLTNSLWEGVCSQAERRLGSKCYKELQGSHNVT